MASTLRVFPPPAAWRVPGGLGRSFRCAGVPVFRRNLDGFGSVRCSVEDSGGESAVQEEKKDVASYAKSSSSQYFDGHGVASGDEFGGWYAAEVEVVKNSWQIAAMQVAAGFLVALGVSLSYYVWCQKQGRRIIPPPPTLTQFQLPSFLKKSIVEPQESNSEDKVDEIGRKDIEGGIGEQLEESLQSGNGKVVESEDVGDAHNNEEQHVSKGDELIVIDEREDEPQDTKLDPSGKLSVSPQDQEKATDGIQGEPQYAASESSAKSESTQLDRKNASGDGEDEERLSVLGPAVKSASTGEPKLSASEASPESRNSRQDRKETRKGSNHEPQLAASQPRKPRRSQRNKRKTSAVQGRRAKVVVPAVVDRVQEQTLAVLQALKVVEEGSNPQDICKRRDYARWVIASSSILTRSPANKVHPAMYIEDFTELAFADVTPDDPDFPYIQGLAEAGLITSNLSLINGDLVEGPFEGDLEEISFCPDSPVSRQELVSWKAALGRRSLSPIDKEVLEAKSGFLDIDRIESRLWSALSDDLDSGENSIISCAFGFTRRFQPDKPVTIGQAAIALACGDTSARFAEELARLQAERMADEAVAADDAFQARQQDELNALFNGQLSAERHQKERAQKLFDELKSEFEKVKMERDAEKDLLLKDKASVESEKKLLELLKEQVDEQLQVLSMRDMQVSMEQDKLETLRLKYKDDEEELSRLLYEAEVEKQALVQARLWAEDEARKARSHAKSLEQKRKRVDQGFSATADRKWQYTGLNARTEIEKLLQRAPLQDVMDKGEDLKVTTSNALIQSWQTILRVLNGFLQRVGEFLQEVRWKTQLYYSATSSFTGSLLRDSASAVNHKFQGSQAAVSDFSTNLGVQTEVFANECKEFSIRVGDGTKKFANECKGGVHRITSRFKHA